jgi:hypothetical protein
MTTVTENTGGSFATAQVLDASLFTLQNDPTVFNSATIPHVSVTAVGDGTWEYFRFTLTSAALVTLDIDHGYPDVDATLTIYNSIEQQIGSQIVFGSNDPGTDGSHTRDPDATVSLGAGTYYVRVSS